MKKEKEQIVFGIRAVIEAIDAGKELERVLIRNTSSKSDTFRELKKKLRELSIPWQPVPVEKLNSITGKNHQGVVAYVSGISYAEIEFILPEIFSRGEQPLLLLLDQVTDVRNFGAIARTAECAGVHAIIVPFRGTARITGEAIKTSAGALHSIPVCRHPNFKELSKYLKDSGLKLFGASEKGRHSVFSADLTGPAAIVMGAEDKGISGPMMEEVDELLSIPLKGTIGSLNVSVASGIMIFEAVRQRSL